ncbi:MAG: patatin-like phospholipase family protein, partial [Myxococcota bacterium]
MTETQHKLGLVLSGGGARAAAHIGALRALTEHGLKPTVISGASAGALVAALYGCRFSLNEMLEVFETTELFSWNHLGFTKKPGLLDAERLVDVLASLFGGLTFNDSDTELHIVTTDLLSGQPHVFTQGPLDRAVTASSAYPGVISPLDIDGRVYADGGIVDNFPIDPLLN